MLLNNKLYFHCEDAGGKKHKCTFSKSFNAQNKPYIFILNSNSLPLLPYKRMTSLEMTPRTSILLTLKITF